MEIIPSAKIFAVDKFLRGRQCCAQSWSWQCGLHRQLALALDARSDSLLPQGAIACAISAFDAVPRQRRTGIELQVALVPVEMPAQLRQQQLDPR